MEASGSPRSFFEDIVKPSYQDWLTEPLREHRAKSAVSQADNMAERMFVYFRENPIKVYNAARVYEYRKALVVNECEDFQIVWDIHDAHKHFRLNRPQRSVTNSDQTGVGQIGFGMCLGEAFGGGECIVVELDNGSLRSLKTVMSNVISMWETLLTREGL